MKSRVLVAFALCAAASATGAFGGQDAASRKAGEIVLEPASLTPPGSGTIEFERGTLYVPENRADPKSRRIGVGFARFRASPASTAPPTFHLPGGPGTSLLSSLKQENPQLARVLKSIERYRAVGDVVFVDQRGFSERGDVLIYRHRSAEEPLDQPGSVARSTEAFSDMARAAVAEYARKGVDLRGYTVLECADDVNDLRQALGYDKISLVGTSFGSQWSFAILKRHGERVARALLSGVEPLDHGYDMPSHVFAAVQRMWWEAEKDPRFKPHLPPGGLMEATREVLRRLDRAPVRVTLKANDPKSGAPVTVTLGREDFQRDAFQKGVAGPAFILSVFHERYEEWATSVLARRRSHDTAHRIIGPLIDTSLGVTPRRAFLLKTDAGTEFLGQWNFHAYLATAEVWPTADVGDDFRAESSSPIPVIFAQGDWDTSTPVENTLHIAPYFPNGRVVIAEHGGHGVLDPIAAHHPEVMGKFLEFLRTGSTAGLPSKVVLPVPKFAAPDVR
jgi:pimeloyl-ACP methyl ester carboxylesterase